MLGEGSRSSVSGGGEMVNVFCEIFKQGHQKIFQSIEKDSLPSSKICRNTQTYLVIAGFVFVVFVL